MTKNNQPDSSGAARALALVLAFLLMLLVWALTIGFWYGVSEALDSGDLSDDDASLLSILALLAGGASIASTVWVAALITKTLTGKDSL